MLHVGISSSRPASAPASGHHRDPKTTGYSDDASVGRYRLSGLLPSGETVESRAPTAALTASTTSGPAPVAITFDGSGSSDPDGDALSHSWTFGDGAGASGASVEHVYETAGTFTATLTVSDGQLSSTASTTSPAPAPSGTTSWLATPGGSAASDRVVVSVASTSTKTTGKGSTKPGAMKVL